jgi:hypothetical protein
LPEFELAHFHIAAALCGKYQTTEDLTRPTFCFAVKYRVDQKAIGTPTLVKVNIVAFKESSHIIPLPERATATEPGKD